MALVAHFDLELHQMDVKTAFLNGDIDETIYMMQPENFVSNESKSMVCKLKKSIYDLKQASRQWYHKFHQVITSYGFEANVVDDCVYHKFSGSKYIFLVLYVNDILLASSDTGLLHETKRFLTKNFEMKDLGEASFVLGIQILRDRSQEIKLMANTSGKVIIPNTPNQGTFSILPIRKEKQRSPEGIKAVWLRKTTNQRFSIKRKILKTVVISKSKMDPEMMVEKFHMNNKDKLLDIVNNKD
ncbi:hypothetical protein CR513_52825, partial [Mucuna pruriens]